jgi:hypothetical protein
MLSSIRTAPRVVAFFALLVAAGLPASGAVVDPTGDVFGAGAVKLDIISTDATTSGGNVTFTVLFSGPISPASAFAADSVLGVIDIDTDQNAGTGATPLINSWISLFGIPGPPVNMGDEFYIDLSSELGAPGDVSIIEAVTASPIGMVPITYSATSFTIVVPLSLLGNDDGLMNYAVVAGTLSEPTDRAPNGDTPLTSALVQNPEPGTFILGSCGVVLVGLAARRRRSIS